MMKHQSFSNIVKRLKISSGHLQKTIQMIEEEQPCLSIAQQLSAVENAIKAAKTILIQDHIDHCLDQTTDENKAQRALIDEFKQITKYL